MVRLILMLFSFTTSWQTFYNSEMIFDGCRVGDTLYLATNGGILKTLLEDTLDILYRYTNLDGLRSPVIGSIESDDSGNIWAISDHHLFFKSHLESRFIEYTALTFPDSLTWIEVIDDQVFISSNLRIVRVDTRGTPGNFGDDLVYQYLAADLGLTGDVIERVRIFQDTVYIVTPLEVAYSSIEDFPESLVIVSKDSLPVGNPDEIRDFVKSGGALCYLTNNAVLFRDNDGSWRAIQWAHLGDQHAWFCCYNTISRVDSGFFIGLGALIGSGNRFLRKLPLVFVDTTGYARVLAPDTVFCNSDYLHISSIVPFNGRVIVGTVCNQSSSIYHNSRKSGGITWIYNGEWRHQRLGLLENNFISGLKRTPDGKVWIYSSFYKIPTYSSRLFVYNNGNFRPVGEFHHGYSVDLVLDVEIDERGNVWVATNGNGIFEFDPNGNLIDHILAGESIKAIGFAPDGSLIYATDDGTFVKTKSGDIPLCPYTNILSISTDQDQKIWIGDEENGFIVFDRNYNVLLTSSDIPSLSQITVRNIAHIARIHYIATTEGILIMNNLVFTGRILPGVWIYSLDIDPLGYLWALSSTGVYVIDTRNNTIKNFFSPLNSGFPVDSIGRDRAFDYMTIRDDILVVPEKNSVWIGTPLGLARVRVNLFENYTAGAKSLKVVPSPVRPGDSYVTVSGLDGKENVFLYSIDGTKVDIEFQRGKGFVRFSSDNLAPGTYFFIAGDKKISFSVIK